MISRVVVKDYKAFGEKIVEWALHPEARPRTLAAFKESLQHILEVPARVQDLQYIESDLETLIIKLPAPDLVRESLDRFSYDKEDYGVPHFYYDKLNKAGPGMSNLDFLYSRIADYTIAQCM